MLLFFIPRVDTLGIPWKPTFPYALFLFEQFFDRPERGKGKHATNGRPHHLFDEESRRHARDAKGKKEPPATGAPVIFRLYHDGVKQPDHQKGGNPYDQSFKVNHVSRFSSKKRGILLSQDASAYRKEIFFLIQQEPPLVRELLSVELFRSQER